MTKNTAETRPTIAPSKQQFRMPTADRYQDWLEDVDRVSDAINAMTYAVSTTVAQLVRTNPDNGIFLHTDDLPTLTMLRALTQAIGGLECVLIGADVDLEPSRRAEQLRSEWQAVQGAWDARRQDTARLQTGTVAAAEQLVEEVANLRDELRTLMEDRGSDAGAS